MGNGVHTWYRLHSVKDILLSELYMVSRNCSCGQSKQNGTSLFSVSVFFIYYVLETGYIIMPS